jgi:glucose/arabinose dehydrogenase
MRYPRQSTVRWALALGVAVAGAGGVSYEVRKQTLAPHELNDRDAPTPILREPPALPNGSINFESAEERNLRIVVVAKGLQQPWSMAFLPDGAMLVTERLPVVCESCATESSSENRLPESHPSKPVDREDYRD